MRATELVHMQDVLRRENLPMPFGFILEPESFDELRRDVQKWAMDYLHYAEFKPELDSRAPFSFMGFWFDRSDVPAPSHLRVKNIGRISAVPYELDDDA